MNTFISAVSQKDEGMRKKEKISFFISVSKSYLPSSRRYRKKMKVLGQEIILS